jgi:D-3-phosphoglycerate dehydrogenase
MQNILITTSTFDTASSPALAGLAAAGFKIIVNPKKRRLTEAEVSDLLAEYAVVGMIAGVEPLTAAVLDRATGLKVISRCGIGLDSVDLTAAAARNIRVTNTPGAPVDAVAELTLALMLDLLRHVSETDRKLRQGEWQPLMGNLLRYQTVGLIGLGRIGSRVAQLVSAFGATVLACDPKPYTVPPNVRLCAMEELLSNSSIVSLHIPYAKSAANIIGARELAAMPEGSFLINAARGGLVDETALASALGSGHLAGAALDTFQTEPYTGPLRDIPQVLMTAHMGSYAKESRMVMESEAAENLVAGLISVGALKA